MSQYHNNLVINTKTLEVVQAQHIIYSVLNLVLLLISNLVAGGARHALRPFICLVVGSASPSTVRLQRMPSEVGSCILGIGVVH